MVKATIEWKDGTIDELKFAGQADYFRFIDKHMPKIKEAKADIDRQKIDKDLY